MQRINYRPVASLWKAFAMLGAAVMGAWYFTNNPAPVGYLGLVPAIAASLTFLVMMKQAFSSAPAFMFDASGLFLGNRTIGWDDVHSVQMRKSGGVLSGGKGQQLVILTAGKRYRFNASTLELTPGGLAALKAELDGHRREGGEAAAEALPEGQADEFDAMIARHIARRKKELATSSKSMAPPPAPLPPKEPPRPAFGRKSA